VRVRPSPNVGVENKESKHISSLTQRDGPKTSTKTPSGKSSVRHAGRKVKPFFRNLTEYESPPAHSRVSEISGWDESSGASHAPHTRMSDPQTSWPANAPTVFFFFFKRTGIRRVDNCQRPPFAVRDPIPIVIVREIKYRLSGSG